MRRLLFRLALVAGLIVAALPGVGPAPAAGSEPMAAESAVPAVTFGTPVRIMSGGSWYGLEMAVDGDGHVHIAIEKASCVECTIADRKGKFYLSDVGRRRGTFPATPTRQTPFGTAQLSLRNSGGHRFLAFAGNQDLDAKAVRVMTDASGRWTTSRVVRHGSKPFLRIGMDGMPRMVFTVGTTVRYARATSLTDGWIKETVASPSGIDGAPVLSIDEQNGAHALWSDRSLGERYARRSPAGWSPIAVPGSTVIPSLSVDKPNKPWIASGGDDLLVHRLVSGAFISQVVDDADASYTAIKVLDSGDLVVAWQGGVPVGLWIIRS